MELATALRSALPLSSPLSPALTVVVLSIATLAAILLTQLAVSLRTFSRQSAALRPVPSAPGGNWLLGHVIPMMMCVKRGIGAWDLLAEWMDSSSSPILKFRILNTHAVVFKDPMGMKRVFQTAYKIYEKDLQISYRPFLPILGTGLVTADGELWQKQRTLMGPALRIDVLDDIISIAKSAVDRLCSKLEAFRGSGQEVELEEEFRLLTLQVIGEAVLSMAPEECDKVFPQLYLPVMEEANRRVLRPYRMYLPTPAWFQFRSRMAQLNTFLISFFRKRWEARKAGGGSQRPRKDILDRILDSIEETGTKWTADLEQQLCYEIKTFLLAGHETSSAMLCWSVFELSLSQECMDKVTAEAQHVFGADEPEPSRRAVDGMTFTLSVLKEALRKYSPVPVVTRRLAQDDELLGHRVPAGTMVACLLKGTHGLYKEPTEFRPERFMPGGEYDQLDEAVRTYHFVPFIQGPRNCLGQHLALLEARVVLSLLCKRFKWRAVHGAAQGRKNPLVVPVGPLKGMPMYID